MKLRVVALCPRDLLTFVLGGWLLQLVRMRRAR